MSPIGIIHHALEITLAIQESFPVVVLLWKSERDRAFQGDAKPEPCQGVLEDPARF
jgi:hypothetical protein